MLSASASTPLSLQLTGQLTPAPAPGGRSPGAGLDGGPATPSSSVLRKLLEGGALHGWDDSPGVARRPAPHAAPGRAAPPPAARHAEGGAEPRRQRAVAPRVARVAHHAGHPQWSPADPRRASRASPRRRALNSPL